MNKKLCVALLGLIGIIGSAYSVYQYSPHKDNGFHTYQNWMSRNRETIQSFEIIDVNSNTTTGILPADTDAIAPVINLLSTSLYPINTLCKCPPQTAYTLRLIAAADDLELHIPRYAHWFTGRQANSNTQSGFTVTISQSDHAKLIKTLDDLFNRLAENEE